MVENIFRHLAHDVPAETADRRGKTVRQAAPHPDRRGRGRQGDLLLGDHHDRRLPAAVHHAGRGRSDLRPDVAHLCLCADRRRHRHLHRDAGDVLDPAAGEGDARSRPSSCGRSARFTSSFCRSRCAATASSAMIAVAFLGVCGVLGVRLGTEFLPKLEEGNMWIRARDAADDHARSRHGHRCPHPQRRSRATLRCGPCFPSRGAVTTAPIRTAPSSPNSSCR